jgi:hypothetical protein
MPYHIHNHLHFPSPEGTSQDSEGGVYFNDKLVFSSINGRGIVRQQAILYRFDGCAIWKLFLDLRPFFQCKFLLSKFRILMKSSDICVFHIENYGDFSI